MNEQEFRHALRGAMTATQPPPAMNGADVLDTAKRARRRRRATLAGVASAAAVTLIAVGATVIPSLSRTNPGLLDAGAPGAEATDAPDTRTSWPDGQTDRTASQGPRYDKGAELLDLLAASIPEGMVAPADLKSSNPEYPVELRSHQAQFAEYVADKQIWEYMATIAVGSDGRWGRLLVEVHAAGNTVPGDGCELATRFWGMDGNCQVTAVGDKQVGLVRRPPGDGQFEEWVSYRHPDGTVVFLAQSRAYAMTRLPGLDVPPLSTQRLAELAVDPKFHLG